MAKRETSTFFPELEGEERKQADEWLGAYLALVLRIRDEHLAFSESKLSTASPLTDSEVLARSVQLGSEPPSPIHHEPLLCLHQSLDAAAGREGRIAPRAARRHCPVRGTQQPS